MLRGVTQQLRPEGLDFLETAPVILRYAAQVEAPTPVVFEAISADPATWTTWFPGLQSGRYFSDPPHGVGSRREVKVSRVGTYRETMLAWDEGTRWCYRVDETSLPIARALIEDWVVEPAGDHTVVRWTFAIDPTTVFRVALLAGKPVIGRTFTQAMNNLGTQLTSKGER